MVIFINQVESLRRLLTFLRSIEPILSEPEKEALAAVTELEHDLAREAVTPQEEEARWREWEQENGIVWKEG